MNFIQRAPSVAAAELVRNFAHWREVGAQEPVMVTHHGRQTHVFMGLERFQTLAGPADHLPRDRTRDLAERLHQGVILCRADMTIDFLNNVALAMTQRWDRQVEGRTLWDALPELAGALTEAHIRHSLASGESSAADIPSPFRADSWLHFQTFPFGGGVALLLRDISSDMQRHRLADVKSAILKAMGVHGAMGYLRLSNRGFIELADAAFCAAIGLSEERLTGAGLPDLVELQDRAKVRGTLEQVLRGEGDGRVDARLLTNAGAVLPSRIALAQLRGAYGNEGAVAVITTGDAENTPRIL